MTAPRLNREVFEKDPREHSLLNQGVAKVTSSASDIELETLRYELRNFVCDGQYADGLARILETFLGHLDKSEQPGVWVSGFFGSGKSHLVKMLQYLWTDYEFPNDKAKARGLVKNLPQNIKDLLKELTNSSKRHGGLHAAAGDLREEAKDSIRLALLGIVFKSVGLPGNYARACFQMWLRDEGLEDSVKESIEEAGSDFENELTHMYVSQTLAKAILAARPDFCAKVSDVGMLLKSQFPPDPSDVSIDDMIARIKQAIGRNGKLPYTVVVLDEVQQYINEDAGRSKAVQDIKEHCCARLGPNFLLIATGQNALSGTALLQRLQGRFPVKVELQDTDVEQVTREVVLKKKTTAEGAVRKLLDEHSGEIERQLASTKIHFTSSDRGLLVQDYPILPVRRRFWERVLRAVDKAGTGAQLRNQLWVVYDAVKKTSELPLGNVISAAFIYDSSIKSSALKSGTLLQEISETIARQRKEEDGELRYELCALIFLIGQLPHNNEPLDAGIRADADTLADLLVTDLTKSSAELRRKVPDLLEKLVVAGAIMRIDNEYRMQTREGAEWNQMFLITRNRMLDDTGKLASERSQLLRSQSSELLKKFKLTQGESKEARKIEIHFGDTPPVSDGSAIPVWIRDGWDVEERTVLNDARAASDSTAMIYGHIPKKRAEELKQALADYYAATTTLQTKGIPSGDEGLQARKAMETQQEQVQRRRDSLITEILNDMSVYLAGGDSVGGTLLLQKVQEAAGRCLDRLFPLFDQADSADWLKVMERSRKGDGDALSLVGHKGSPEEHAVCKAVRDFVGSGKKGGEVRAHFAKPRYGWPRDAVDAALIVLFQSGVLQARSASEPVPKGKLEQKSIATAEFRCETIPSLGPAELLQVRKLFQDLNTKFTPGLESASVSEYLSRLQKLAESAGGSPPLPHVPDVAHLTDIANRVGNDQLRTLHEHRERLAREAVEWKSRKERIAERRPRWERLNALLGFASDLAVAAEVQPEIQAIADERRMLAEPDPVPGPLERLTSVLRTELNAAHHALASEHETRFIALESNADWRKLTPEQKYGILSQQSIREIPPVEVGTADQILDTLRKTKLSELHARKDALPTRFSNALAAAARLLEPKAQHVSLPSGTIKNDDDLRSWLTSAEETIRAKLVTGPVIV